MTSSESAEQKGSERSSTECPGVRDGVHCFKHRNTCCYCAQEPPASKLRCKGCGHTEGEGCGCPAHAFVSKEHCWRCEGTALIKDAGPEPCEEHPNAPVIGGMCGGCTQYPQDMKLPPPEGPEYTPCACGHIEPEHRVQRPGWTEEGCYECDCTAYRTEPDFVLPPQPERRPPYAVAYSIGGHLYELALPGDAAVQTVDGALIITHALGPVNGVVQVQPIESKEA